MHSPPTSTPTKAAYTKNTQSISAALCALTYAGSSSVSKTERETIALWMSNIGNELNLPDSQLIQRDGELKIELKNTCEPDALQIARLIRNSFQLSLIDNRKVSLSIGVILYRATLADQLDSDQHHPNELNRKLNYGKQARDLAVNSFDSSKNNRILFENTTQI